MKLSSKQPYDILDDGTIRIHEDQYEELKSMFLRGGFDIEELRTVEQFELAFSKTGDKLIEGLISRAKTEEPARKILRAFAAGDFSEAKAQAARATFGIIK